jgi:hypothetical protein
VLGLATMGNLGEDPDADQGIAMEAFVAGAPDRK